MIKHLTLTFIKVFFRNTRAVFFVILLPLGIFVAAALLGLKDIVRFEKPFPYYDFLLTGVIALALMQTGIYTVAYNFIDYRRARALKRLAVTPLRPSGVMLAQVFARFGIALIQIGVLLGVGIVFFGTKIVWLALLSPLVIFLGNTIFLNIGFLIASFAQDYEQAAPYTTIIGTILLFLGDAFFPLENLPRVLIPVAEFLPFKPLVSLVRYFFLGISDGKLLSESLILVFWFLAVSLIAKLVFSKRMYR